MSSEMVSSNIHAYAQIRPSNGIVENLVELDITQSNNLSSSFTWVDITGLTCTDGTPIQSGCTYVGTSFYSLPLDTYSRVITMYSDGVNDYYTVTNQLGVSFGVSVPVGTSQSSAYSTMNSTQVPTLAQAIAIQEQSYSLAVQSYRGNYFTQDQVMQFLALWVDALMVSNLPNRAAYIQPLVTWMKDIISYSSTYVASLVSQSSAASILSTQWNFSSVAVSPPSITLAGALAINS